ncbi:LPS-assembly protein LptD [Pseudoprimorskyibacter insulae]|uniref:LPS-assembly protein LptD n=1 Tax=Pseudoprimorskyibacter insulae TaxID=1695997 RepID=A0A2R8AVY9_9RHOB|nr:LPS assembly protein LptD [Pseudoprimorskyibacter insulae]SPF80186.1 LPS-assembly protein LptD [Pseudoprimorskyibacter insulae]
MRHLIAAAALAAGLAAPALAQTENQAALLVADRVLVESDNRLIAEGKVEAFQDGVRLTASRIVYDRDADSLTIEGPIRLSDSNGNLLIADSADLDIELRNGLLRGARLVLDEQLQLASVQARRVEGRYTQMSKVAITSCQVCGEDTPLWQIRARNVVHDEEAKQIYIDEAQLRILDVPVFYLPHLRLPDPTLTRARGFLIPEILSSTLLGTGVRMPYFVPLGDHADITFAPYLSPVTRTIEARYRHAFRTGTVSFDTAISRDTVQRDTTRAYLFGEGAFDLRNDFKLTFDIEAVNDRSYLSDYNYSDKDRLDSELRIERVRPDEYITGALIHYESLRANESNATLPTIVGNVEYERRFLPAIGGELRYDVTAHSHFRYSETDVDGRDVTRLNAGVTYLNRWTLPAGIRAGFTGSVWADHVNTVQDSTADAMITQLTPQAAVEVRWPWVRNDGQGGGMLLEPVAQIGWTGGTRPNIANDESTRVELDEANLLSLSRFPAPDRRERGWVGAAGIRWMRYAPAGWSAGLTLGRIWRDTADAEFSRSSGLMGETSDWLLAMHFTGANGLDLVARGLLDNAGRFAKAEIRGVWDYKRLGLEASYVLQSADPAVARNRALSEWTMDATYQLAENWTGSTLWRYDIVDNRLDRAGVGLDYSNECIDVGFSVSRRFASSINIEPTTNYGLTVALKGFSTGGSAKEYRRTCR